MDMERSVLRDGAVDFGECGGLMLHISLTWTQHSVSDEATKDQGFCKDHSITVKYLE